MDQTHPLAVAMYLSDAVVNMVLVSLSIVAKDLACVQEEAIDLEVLGEVIDQVDRLLLNHVLVGPVFQNRASGVGEQRRMDGGQRTLRADEDEEDVRL